MEMVQVNFGCTFTSGLSHVGFAVYKLSEVRKNRSIAGIHEAFKMCFKSLIESLKLLKPS
jgi:hypothetical protein